ncbi:uncharacterized protein LOC144861804 [Branchiostoma floridae x Branchiostoma japonicum]
MMEGKKERKEGRKDERSYTTIHATASLLFKVKVVPLLMKDGKAVTVIVAFMLKKGTECSLPPSPQWQSCREDQPSLSIRFYGFGSDGAVCIIRTKGQHAATL